MALGLKIWQVDIRKFPSLLRYAAKENAMQISGNEWNHTGHNITPCL